jgi:uncharacterized protein
MATIGATDQSEPDMASLVVEALCQGLGDRLLAVVLFGSRARGDANQTSDWDMLVIAQNLPEKPFARRLYLKQLLPLSCRGAVSILARTPTEFKAHLPSLYLDIALDGRVLHDPTGYVTREMVALKLLMKQVGLYREKTSAGEIWRWQTEPTPDWHLAW